tara:strand:+ start:857 stop:1474 length:618 start_codon:yes stop_codon:yes gene_type:complete
MDINIYSIEFIALASIFYLVGSIPFGYLLTKLFGLGDIRKIGSGNIGTTNVLRTGNKTLAFIVLVLDVLKGYLPLIIIKEFYIIINYEFFLIYLLTSFTIIGHIYPIWLKFKGGKGVATYIGYIFAINYVLGTIFIFSWLIIALLTKYSSLASIISLLILSLSIYFMQFNFGIMILLFLINIIIIFKHYSNILRLLKNIETKIKF